MPESNRRSRARGAQRGLMYVIGGSGAIFGRTNRADIWAFSFAQRRWRELHFRYKRKHFEACYGHTAVLHGDRIIVFGGAPSSCALDKRARVCGWGWWVGVGV